MTNDDKVNSSKAFAINASERQLALLIALSALVATCIAFYLQVTGSPVAIVPAIISIVASFLVIAGRKDQAGAASLMIVTVGTHLTAVLPSAIIVPLLWQPDGSSQHANVGETVIWSVAMTSGASMPMFIGGLVVLGLYSQFAKTGTRKGD